MITPEIQDTLKTMRPYRDATPSTDGMVEIPQKELERLCDELSEMRMVAGWMKRLNSADVRWFLTAVWTQVITLLIALICKAVSAGWHFTAFSCLGAFLTVFAIPFILSVRD